MASLIVQDQWQVIVFNVFLFLAFTKIKEDISPLAQTEKLLYNKLFLVILK